MTGLVAAVSSSSQWNPTEIATIVMAVATLILAAVAVSQKWVSALLWRPSLDASIPKVAKTTRKAAFKKRPPDNTIYMVDAYYYWLIIENRSKLFRAQDVEVSALKLEERDEKGEFHARDSFISADLIWYETRRAVLNSLAPRTVKWCLLGALVMQNQVNFRLAVLPELVFNASQEVSDIDILFSDSMGWGDVYPYEMRKGTYQLVLQLAGTNCRPKTKKIEITVAEEEPHVGVRMLT